ncbi:MAG: enoyl-CoA hydratase/isomerase family protein [Alicyclobacillus herbarius]|uniref:enoyl-CoA hydratase/isomerase family protein n=1 Tax=Alicyclobacillus herbarius TaxID=122960 RepID=UPI002353AA3E|nr:enoyl-CoA hydratase-related protein [Alicyclobacillus herbarius]MCL6634111.1 enoyl-CoA hydratase/isomerase family protein [Alicyclobacillus herbarius]
MTEILSYSVYEGVAWIEIDNPPVNALNLSGFVALLSHLATAEEDERVRVIVITGNGNKAFVAGIDVKEVLTFGREEMVAFNRVSGSALRRLESMRKPVIAVVGGIAYGAGFELALACDFRIAAEHAVFALPELTLGIIPGGGGTQRLTRLIGEARAKEIIMLGRSLDAARAKELGLLCEVCAADALREKAHELANELMRRPAVALAEAKRAIHAALDGPLEEGLMLENEAFLTAFASADGREGIAAFAEKRKPVFVGR